MSSEQVSKQVKTIYEITVHLDDGKKFTYRVPTQEKVHEDLKALAAIGYFDNSPGCIVMYPAHRITKVVAYGTDLNKKVDQPTPHQEAL